MIRANTALLDAMIEAYQMEKALREFYERASSRATDQEVQGAFGKLAEWETEHMRYIQFLYQAIRDEREMLSFEHFKKTAPAGEIEGGMPVQQAELTFGNRRFQNDRDALNVALEIETEARDLYQRLSGSVEDANTAVFLRDMVRQEERHIEFVKKLLVSTNP